jgi:uncharacterized membrane protein YbhN (UPF0104 family)
MDKQRLWGIAKVLLKIGFTGGLIYLVFQKINFNDVKTVFLQSNPLYIAIALLLYFLSMVMASWRMLVFLKSIGIDLKFGFSFRLYMLGAFYNIFLPGGVGGDGYKIYILAKKYKFPTKRVFWALFLERLSGVWAICFIMVTLIMLIPQIEIHVFWPLSTLIVSTGVYYFLAKKFFADYSRYFLKAHLLSGAIQSITVLIVISILLSQDFHGKFSPYLLSFLASTLVSVINIGIGGLGVRDFAMTHASGIFGMDQTIAVFITTTFWMISIIVSLPGLWFVYHAKEFDPVPTTKEAKEAEKESDTAFKGDKL